jgi:hypothetical protein
MANVSNPFGALDSLDRVDTRQRISTFPYHMVAISIGNAVVAAGPIHKQRTPNPNAAWWFRPRSAAASL